MNPSDIYHERQSLMLCAVHCLNNLFQTKAFTKQSLDAISNSLSPDEFINPHKSIFGLGNYDVNVLIKALDAKNCELNWYDRRKELTPTTIKSDRALGYILNIPNDYSLGFFTLPLKRRHWICIRKLNEQFWNLDSKLNHPICIGNEQEVVIFLQQQINTNDKELFLVIPKEEENS
ncbi:unnamed protein product [Diamesa serratosioi]